MKTQERREVFFSLFRDIKTKFLPPCVEIAKTMKSVMIAAVQIWTRAASLFRATNTNLLQPSKTLMFERSQTKILPTPLCPTENIQIVVPDISTSGRWICLIYNILYMYATQLSSITRDVMVHSVSQSKIKLNFSQKMNKRPL